MRTQRGFSIIEIIVAMGIVMIISVTAITTVVGSFSTNRLGDEQTRASQYAQEGIEAVRSIKNQGWTTPFLATSCVAGCGIASGASWSWSGTSNTLTGMTRIITVSPVSRDGSGNVVSSGGTNDPDTRKVTSTVTWNFTPTRSDIVSFSTYLTNFRKAIASNWSTPTLEAGFDLTVANSGTGTANGISIAYASNYVYLGRTSGSNELVAINVSTLTAPTICGTCRRTLSGNVNDIKISGNYAFIASSNNAQELQIINISSPTTLSTASLTTFDLTTGNSGNANGDAMAIAISGTNLYMARNSGMNEFLKFNISTPTAPTLISSSNALLGVPSEMVIVGNYAYVTTDNNNPELQVFDLTTMALVGTLNLNSGNDGANATSIVYAGGNKILVGRVSSAAPELYSIDITIPSSPALVSTAEIGSNVTDVQFDTSTIFLATNNGTQDFITLDGSNLNSLPALPPLGQLDISNSPSEIIYEPTLTRVFVASTSDTEELEIIKP